MTKVQKSYAIDLKCYDVGIYDCKNIARKVKKMRGLCALMRVCDYLREAVKMNRRVEIILMLVLAVLIGNLLIGIWQLYLFRLFLNL